MRSRAEAAYERGAWLEALEDYERLVSLFPEEACLHGRLAGCALAEPGRLALVRRHLRVALRKGCTEPDLPYHQARLAQLEYDFEKARDLYSAYLAAAGKKARFKAEAERGEKACDAVIWDPSEAVALKVLERVPSAPDAAFRYYNPDVPGLRLVAVPEALQSKADKKWGAGRMAFHDGDTVLVFSSLGKKGNNGWDLFRVSIRGGAYTEPVRLEGAVNTGFDERDAYLAPDGLLYFTSNRPGGLGGYDIYAVSCGLDGMPTGVPRRLPYPVNSVNDDLFFIPEAEGGAWMASNRAAVQGKIHAYRVALTSDRVQTGSVAWSADEVVGEGLKLRVFSGGEMVAERDMADGGAQHLAYAGEGSVRVVLEDADGRILAESFGEEQGAWQLQKSASGWSLEDQSDVLADWAVLADLQAEDGGSVPVVAQGEEPTVLQTGWDAWWQQQQEQEQEPGADEASASEAVMSQGAETGRSGNEDEDAAEISAAKEAADRASDVTEEVVDVDSDGQAEVGGTTEVTEVVAWDGKSPLSAAEVDLMLEESPEEILALWESKGREVLELERSFLDDPSFAKAGELYDGVDDMAGLRPRADMMAEEVRDGVDTDDITVMLDTWTRAVQSATKASLAKVAGDAALALRREKLAIRELAAMDGFDLGRAKLRWSDWRDANRGVPGVSRDAAQWSREEGDAVLFSLEQTLAQAEDLWSRRQLSGWRGDWLRREKEQVERMKVVWEASWGGATDEELALLESGEMKTYKPSDDVAAEQEDLVQTDDDVGGSTEIAIARGDGDEEVTLAIESKVAAGEDALESEGLSDAGGMEGMGQTIENLESGSQTTDGDTASREGEAAAGADELDGTSSGAVGAPVPDSRFELSEGLDRMDLLFPALDWPVESGLETGSAERRVEDVGPGSEWARALAESRRVQREWEQLMEVVGPEGWVAPSDDASFRSLRAPVQEAWVAWRRASLEVLEEIAEDRRKSALAAMDSLETVMGNGDLDDDIREGVMEPFVLRREALLRSKPEERSRPKLEPADEWALQGELIGRTMDLAMGWGAIEEEVGDLEWELATQELITAAGEDPTESRPSLEQEEEPEAPPVAIAASSPSDEAPTGAVADEGLLVDARKEGGTPVVPEVEVSSDPPSTERTQAVTGDWPTASPEDFGQILESSGSVDGGDVDPVLLRDLSELAEVWSEQEEALGAVGWRSVWTDPEWALLTAMRERIEWGVSPPDAGATRSERMAYDKAVFFADRRLRKAWSEVDLVRLESRLRSVLYDEVLTDLVSEDSREAQDNVDPAPQEEPGDVGGDVLSETDPVSDGGAGPSNPTPVGVADAATAEDIATALVLQEDAAREFGVALPAAEVVGRRSDGNAGKGLRLRPIAREAMERSILGGRGRLDPDASAAVRFADERGAPIEEGTEYKVQVGAFRNALPAALFAAFDPMWAQSLNNGITRYMAGSFDAYDAAVEARDAIRALGYEDAFVVRFVDGVRVVGSRPEPETLAEERRALAEAAPAAGGSPSNDVGRSSDVAGGRVPDSTLANQEIEAAEDIPTWENVEGRVYSVQVGAFRGVPDRDALARLGTLTREDTGADGWLRLFSGRFSDQVSAEQHRDELKADGLSDAFIVVYINGRRIPLLEASTTAIGSLPRAQPVPDEQEAISDADDLLEGGDETEEEGGGFVVELGVFNSTIPVRLANAILDAPLDWEVRSVRNNGLTRYRTRPVDEETVQGWLTAARSMGFSNARIIGL